MVEEAWKPEMVFWMQFDLWQLLWESVSLMCSISLETLMHSFFFYCNKLQSLDILHFSSSVLPGIDHVQIVQCYAFSKPGSSQASIFCKAVQHLMPADFSQQVQWKYFSSSQPIKLGTKHNLHFSPFCAIGTYADFLPGQPFSRQSTTWFKETEKWSALMRNQPVAKGGICCIEDSKQAPHRQYFAKPLPILCKFSANSNKIYKSLSNTHCNGPISIRCAL